MRFSIFPTLALSTLATARPWRDGAAQGIHQDGEKTPAFLLAGDSTTAVDGGWGNGLLATLKEGAWGLNVGKSGATTVSFENEGYWKNVTDHLRQNAEEFDCYVTISFGHNDQKPANHVSFDLYQSNLIRFANVVKDLGGTPLLVSSLTRRNFASDGTVIDSLHNETLAARAAASETESPFINLNQASAEYVQAIGETEAHKYNWGPGDNTHLNPRGEVVFGRIVADLIVKELPLLRPWIQQDQTMSDRIEAGLPV